jgi:hypothetical protein
MPNTLATVAGHISHHSTRRPVAAAATVVMTTMIAVAVTERAKQWKLFFRDPEAFDAQYPAK